MAVWFPETLRPRSPSSVYLMLIQHLHRAVPAQPGSWRGCRGKDGEKWGSHGGETPALRALHRRDP